MMKRALRYILIFSILLASFNARPENDPISKPEFQDILSLLDYVEETMKGPSSSAYVACEDIEKNGPGAKKKEACIRKYAGIVRREKLDIQVFGGYLDSTPGNQVNDAFERAAFIEKLTQACRPGSPVQTCGFKRDEDDADLLTKDVRSPASGTIRVEIRFAASSISSDDKKNRLSEEQERRSAEVEAKFVDALKSADVVFYSGHSRNGGGPDFRPPRLEPDGHVDFAWYRQNRPGLARMLEGLKARQSDKLPLLALFSCDSLKEFGGALSRANVSGTALTTALLTDVEAEAAMLESLNSVVSLSCEPSLGIPTHNVVSTGFGGKI